MNHKTLEVRPVDSTVFLQLVRRHSFSEETGGRLTSQFESEIREDSERIGLLGLYCCGNLCSALSYAHTELVHTPGAYEARLDVVLTLPESRGMGLGTLLMAGFFVHSTEVLGDRLAHCSTIALHPAVEHFVSRFDFQSLGEGQAPLFSLALDEQNRAEFATQVRAEFDRRMQSLRVGCMGCLRRSWTKPWCGFEPQRKVPA